jgi:hypothetical protein
MRMKSLILHFSNEEDYDHNLETFWQKRIYKRNLVEQLKADQKLVDSIENGKEYNEKPDNKNLVISILNGAWKVVWSIISFVPKQCIELLVRKTVKDPHFYGTMRFTYTMFLYPVIFLIMYLLIRFLLIWIN